MKNITSIISLVALTLLSQAGFAKVDEAAAAKLKGELTPIGAERAGNEDGTIPAWTGGIQNTPSEYKVGDHHQDPFADEKPLFVINRANLEQHKDKLSAGQIAMFKNYPDYKIQVFPSHRTASYPQKVYDYSIKNATQATLSEDGAGLKSAQVGVPFPMPNSGLEAIWNHLTRYRGESVKGEYLQVAAQKDGSFTPFKFTQETLQFYVQEQPEKNDFLFLYKQRVTAPSRKAGEVVLVHETLNQLKDPRRAWRYDPGRRRASRTPTVAYDAPALGADGLATVDNFDMFSGSPDRYNWKLVGKKEMYVPYNAYQLHSKNLKYEDIIQPGHLNQDYTRYELHRVWVLEANLKEGEDHIYSRRTVYLDEDSWQAVLIDHYDNDGDLWRVAEAHVINYYEVPVLWSTVTNIYDLKEKRYVAQGLNNQEEMYSFNDEEFKYKQFTSSALRREGR